MNFRISIFLIFMLTSCSSNKHKFEVVKSKTAIFYDPLSRNVAMVSTYPGIDELAKKYLANGRINRDQCLSCLQKPHVVNYINISREYVPLYRPYVISFNKTIDYKKIEGFRDGQHGALYTKTIMDHLKVETKVCFKKFKGEHAMVVSEYYRYEED